MSENYFLISENQFLISENDFLISEIIFWYQKLFSDNRKSALKSYSARNYFLISENDFGYQWYFRISGNNFWYQKLFSDIRKSKFPLVFAKINRYLIMFAVLESKLGHDPMVTNKLPVYLEQWSLGHEQSRECNELYAQLQNIHANHTNCTK